MQSREATAGAVFHNFVDGRFVRLSSKLYPIDTRLYTKVLREGVIRPGDEIRVLPE